MEIIKFKNKYDALVAAGKALTTYLKENINNEVLFLSSGGSSLPLLDNIDPIVLSKKITVTVLDTRLDVKSKDENFIQLKETRFYAEAKNKGVQFLDISHLNNLSFQEAEKTFDSILKNWTQSHIGAKIIATIGMGQDGHIAGIMPFSNDEKTFNRLFKNKNQYAIAYEAPEKIKFPKRLTATFPFLERLDRVFSYIVGDDKKQKFLELTSNKDYSLHQFPAAVLQKLNNVSIFTDINLN